MKNGNVETAEIPNHSKSFEKMTLVIPEQNAENVKGRSQRTLWLKLAGKTNRMNTWNVRMRTAGHIRTSFLRNVENVNKKYDKIGCTDS